MAEPGAVVIAAATRRLTGGLFDYRDLGTTALKGFAENVPAWQVLGAMKLSEYASYDAFGLAGLVRRSFELRAALSLAKLYRSTDRPAGAHAILASALKGFSPTPEFPEIEQAQALLAALAS